MSYAPPKYGTITKHQSQYILKNVPLILGVPVIYPLSFSPTFSLLYSVRPRLRAYRYFSTSPCPWISSQFLPVGNNRVGVVLVNTAPITSELSSFCQRGSNASLLPPASSSPSRPLTSPKTILHSTWPKHAFTYAGDAI